ncbi:MAG: TlpA family protein disulfide reductase [Tannerellaceae bacterium]|nr:TlpA family protein disulfide reductase [Tannerellaceae bacterium]
MRYLNIIAVCLVTCILVTGCNNQEKGNDQLTHAVQEDPAAIVTEEETAREEITDDRGYIVHIGEMAPDFMIEYVDGRSEKLSDLKDKLVMIQFTASWCGVCRKEMPYIERDIWQKHKNNPHFALIGIDLKEDKETTAKFAEHMKISYPLTLDTDGSRFGLFTAQGAGVTRNIILDKEGKIVLLTRLFEMEEFNEMVAFINHYLETEF